MSIYKYVNIILIVSYIMFGFNYCCNQVYTDSSITQRLLYMYYLYN